jgi:hypothetical protein
VGNREIGNEGERRGKREMEREGLICGREMEMERERMKWGGGDREYIRIEIDINVDLDGERLRQMDRREQRD